MTEHVGSPRAGAGGDAGFRKDLGHLTWAEVYARQAMRAGLVDEWMEALRLMAGDHVLDVGSGPGYVSLVLAERVGPGGIVHAIDRSPEALAYLERLQKDRAIGQIRRVIGDAATLDLQGFEASSALITMVLHHANRPAAIIGNVAKGMAPGSLAIVAEFHPEGPCEQGPPRTDRVEPEQVRAWCEDAGLSQLHYRRQTPEHYMVLLQQPT